LRDEWLFTHPFLKQEQQRVVVETYCWLALPVPVIHYSVTAQGCVCRLGGDRNKGLAA